MTATPEPLKLTPPWAYYRRKGLSEMRPYAPGEDMGRISVSEVDRRLISFALDKGLDPGGYVARNPKNHEDQWYVAQAYFDANLEPADAPERDDAAELRAAVQRYLDTLDGFGEPRFDSTTTATIDPLMESLDALRAALAATEGRGDQ